MPPILNVNFPESALVKKALQSFYGIGPLVSSQILARHFIHPTATIGALTQQKLLDITAQLTGMKIENDARREVRENIKRLRNIGTVRGRRHAMGLPVHGQHTKSGQAKTARKLNRLERKG